MKRVVLLFIFVCLGQLAAAQTQVVRVRLMTSKQNFKVSGIGLQFQNLSQPFRQVAIPSNSQMEVRTLNKNGKKLWALRVTQSDIEHVFKDKYLLIQGENLRVGSKEMPSRLLLSQSSSDKIDVVGVMPLDDYLVGVLASEMPLSWPLETLKAQVVAARSYALATIAERHDQTFHLESSVMDQVFRHILNTEMTTPLVAKALRAVKETQNQVLRQSNGHVLKTYFHSDCGGRTTAAKNVWNSDSPIVDGAVDASCPTSPTGNWQLKLSAEELGRRLGGLKVASLTTIRVPSEERVQRVQVHFKDGTSRHFTVNSFRQFLGFQNLKSSIFEVGKKGESYIFQGKGLGHGVGLCQWGSRMLGKKGLNYKQILSHYYPQARLH